MSIYRLLCLNHAPALVLDKQEWNEAEHPIAAAGEPGMHDWLTEDHGRCDLLVGEFSYPLVRVCCPANFADSGHAAHGSSRWIDREWLALLCAVHADPDPSPGVSVAFSVLVNRAGCWSRTRLERLAPLLGVGCDEGGAS